MNEPVKFVPFPFLAALLTLGIGCGGHDEPSEKGELGEYFAEIQGINDEYQRRLNDANKDTQDCAPEFDGTARDRNTSRANKARVIGCLTEEGGSFSSARQEWLSQMRAVHPPEHARAAHQVLTKTGGSETVLRSPTNSTDGGIDPAIIHFLDACEEWLRWPRITGSS
jgi:hypothetical protein